MNKFARGAGRWVARLYLLYLALSFFVVLPALNIMTPKLAQQYANRELNSEIILFNPFNLALQLRNASVHEADGHQPIALKLLEVNLSTSSLWRTGIVLDAIRVEELDVDVLRYAHGGFHFDDLLVTSEEPPEDANTEIPAVTIHDFYINAERLHFTDRTKPGAFETTQRDFVLHTRNLTTVPDEEGNGRLELTSDGGGLFRWNGDLDVAGGRSSGKLTLENVDLTPAWRYESDALDFVAHDARLDIDFDYRANWSGDFQLILSNGHMRLHTLDLRPQDEATLPDTFITLEEVSLDGLAMDLAKQSVDVQTLAVNGLRVSGFDKDGEVSVLQMFTPASSEGGNATNEPDALAQPNTQDPDSTAWTMGLGKFSLTNSNVDWRSEYIAPQPISVSPLDISAAKLHWPATDSSPFSVALTLNGQSSVDMDGLMNIGSGSGELTLDLDSLQLPWLNPLVIAQARTDISQGTLSVQASAVIDEFAPSTVSLALQLRQFATQLHATGEEAFTLEELAVEGATVSLTEQYVNIEQVSLLRPAGSLHILEDGTMNVNGIVRGGEATEDTQGDEGDEGADNAAPADEEADDVAPDWQIALTHFSLRDGQLDFADDALPLPFQTVIGDITADMRDLDTAAENPLTLNFDGNVDGYAPVKITGRGRPLAAARDGELEFTFKGMDIATMSPYSGAYAGYAIDSGTLSLDLRYALNGQTLDGDNRIVISQLGLGERIESERAIDLPLKLGLALLTDSQGVIDLSVPVSGDVDDPSFSLGSIIGTAVKNIFVKAVSAPFSLLAGLVGSDDDLENVPFLPGEETLNPAAERTLKTLSEALQQRPQLALQIAGASDPDADGRALREAALGRSLLAEGLSEQQLSDRGQAFADAVSARFIALTAATGTDDAGSDEGAGSNEGADSEDRRDEGTTVAPTLAEQWDALVGSTELPAGALRDLATNRAAAAKRELVTVDGIAAERITISYDPKLTVAITQMRVQG